MGSKVCGLCEYYKVDSYEGNVGDRGDACTIDKKKPVKVSSRQDACESYEGFPPIILPDWFNDMIKKNPKYRTYWDNKVGWWRPTEAYEKADKEWWEEYFKKKAEAIDVKEKEAEKTTKKTGKGKSSKEG